MKLAKCLRDEGFREKLLCRPPAIVAGTFAEAASVGPVVLEFALILREHSSSSHTQMALLWLPEISPHPRKQPVILVLCGRKILPPCISEEKGCFQ